MNYFEKIQDEIINLGFRVSSKDFDRPWGGFLVIDENQSQEFLNKFFSIIDVNTLKILN